MLRPTIPKKKHNYFLKDEKELNKDDNENNQIIYLTKHHHNDSELSSSQYYHSILKNIYSDDVKEIMLYKCEKLYIKNGIHPLIQVQMTCKFRPQSQSNPADEQEVSDYTHPEYTVIIQKSNLNLEIWLSLKSYLNDYKLECDKQKSPSSYLIFNFHRRDVSQQVIDIMNNNLNHKKLDNLDKLDNNDNKSNVFSGIATIALDSLVTKIRPVDRNNVRRYCRCSLIHLSYYNCTKFNF